MKITITSILSSKTLCRQVLLFQTLQDVFINICSKLSLKSLMTSVFILEHHLQVKKALQRPEKLTAVFQTVNGSLEGLFSWQVTEAAPGQTPITGFQFSWVKVSGSTVNASPDTLISQMLNLAPVS